MNTAAKLGTFSAALALTFGGSYAIGQTADAMGAHDTGGHSMPGSTTDMGHHDMGGHDMGGMPGMSGHGSTASPGSAVLPGLAVTTDGYTLVPRDTALTQGPASAFRFVITGPDDKPLTSYTPSHTKDLHLVVVRRDLVGFQHVHPTRAADGTWSTELNLTSAGTYRVFADFVPGGMTAPIVLGTDVSVAGDYRPEQLPAAATNARVGEYDVALSGAPSASSEAKLTFTVTRRGAPVTTLQPYLGAFGHLVALRAGDLAYLHTHPGEQAAAGAQGGPDVSFMTEFPSRASYRLFLDFQVDGTVQTAAFTVTVSR